MQTFDITSTLGISSVRSGLYVAVTSEAAVQLNKAL